MHGRAMRRAADGADVAVELECKVAVASHDKLAEKLRAGGGEYLGSVIETNQLFDNPQQALLARGCGLRVRSVRVVNGYAEGVPATMTFKGPTQASAFKRREEIELPIGDANAMTRLLSELDFFPWLTFEKRRSTWRLPPTGNTTASCTIELDELPQLGCFVEIEGPTEEAIRQVADKIGIDTHNSISRSYAALVAEHLGAATRPIELRF